MGDGGEGQGGFAAVSGGEGQTTPSQQSQGEDTRQGGEQDVGGLAAQLAETRQAAAAIYQYSQQQAQQLAQLQAQMGPLTELQQRLTGPKDNGPPPIENYDEYLVKLMKSQNALMEQYKQDQIYREQLQQQYEQQRQAEYQQQLGAWLNNAVSTTDQSLTEAGYPGFKESLPTIAAYVENEIRQRLANGQSAQSPEFIQYWSEKVDSPQYWADIFVREVLPMYKDRIVGRYERMGDRRQMMRIPTEEAEYRGRQTIR